MCTLLYIEQKKNLIHINTHTYIYIYIYIWITTVNINLLNIYTGEVGILTKSCSTFWHARALAAVLLTPRSKI